MKKIILSTIAVLAIFVGYGQAGSLDPAFGGSGWTAIDFGKGNFYPESGKQIIMQTNGTFIVVFDINAYTVLARYLTKNNTLDKSYGTEGFSVPVHFQNGKAALQSDGKVVVTGLYNVGDHLDFGVARFNTDGSLDNSFGTNGIQTTDFFGSWDWPFDIAIQTDGKIVVVGQTESSTYDFAIARYTTTGTLDPEFGTNGKVVTDFFGGSDWATGIAIQTDGKIVVAGQIFNTGGTNDDFGIARYNENGTLDESFGVSGLQTTDFQGYDYAYAVALQGDGKIVVAGQSNTSITGSDDFAVARYNVDGTLDNTFDTDGKQTTDLFGWYDKANTVALQSDGKIVLGGTGNIDNQNFDFCLVRYNTDGSLDTGFDGDGKLTTDFFGDQDIVYNIAIQSDGKIIAVGDAMNANYGFDFAVARYNTNGSIDRRFDRDGKLTGYYPAGVGYFRSVAVQADGKIVAAGQAYNTNYNSDFVLARFNADGTLDKTFNRSGIQTTDFSGQDDCVYAIAIQSDGKIVVAGATVIPDPNDPESYLADFALARYNSNGSIDNKFDKDGRQTTDFFGEIDEAYDMAIEPNGKIVVAGRVVTTETGYDFGLARYNANGSLDGTFGSGGKLTTDFSGSYDNAYGIVLQSDGKIVAAGMAYTGGYSEFALARYTSNGTLDVSFDGDGRQTTHFFDYYEYGYDVAIQGDKIIVSGSIGNGVSSVFGLARYNISDGSLDASFGDNGKQTTQFFSRYNDANAMAIQGDGKIILVGGVLNVDNGSNDFGLARYTPDGLLDETFGVDGKQTSAFSGGYDDAFGAAIGGTTLYVAGSTRGPVDKCIVAAYTLGTVLGAPPIVTNPPLKGPGLHSALTVKVQPNPTNTFFTLLVQSPNASPASIRISNGSGQVIEAATNIPSNGKLQFGSNYQPGIYYFEVVQGTDKVVVKVVKQ